MTFTELRKSRGFSQVQLANEVGVDQSTVSLWEQGKTAPRRETVLRLAEIMGCTRNDVHDAIEATAEARAG